LEVEVEPAIPTLASPLRAIAAAKKKNDRIDAGKIADCLPWRLVVSRQIERKAASASTSSAGPHGGNEMTVVSLFIAMAHLGFIIVPTGYTHEKVVQGHGTPCGASSVSGQNLAAPTAEDLEVAKHQGARVAQVAAL
jgi:multimeric flavodoxin WrbA